MALAPIRRRRQPSTIDRLPAELRELIAKLRKEGRSVSEIHDHLSRLDAGVSRSAVGRHLKSMAEVGEEMRRAQEMARFVVEELGDEPDERVARANMRILQGGIMQLLMDRPLGEDGEPIRLDAAEAKEISLSLQRLVSAQRMEADRVLRLQAEARRATQEEAARKLDAAAKTGEVDPAAVAQAKRIMGFT